jgi:hypothetical protein
MQREPSSEYVIHPNNSRFDKTTATSDDHITSISNCFDHPIEHIHHHNPGGFLLGIGFTQKLGRLSYSLSISTKPY